MKFLVALTFSLFIWQNLFSAKPNIVIILTDDMGIGDVSAYNKVKSGVTTTHMDNLAAGGMMFTNAHTSSAICSPTRYGLMMGEHPMRVNKLSYQRDYDDVWIKDTSKRTIAGVLKDGGYNTLYVGKWHLGFNIYKEDGTKARGISWNYNENLKIDWSKGVDNGPSQRGFDRSFGHLSSADIAPFKYVENGKFLTDSTYWLKSAGGGKNSAIDTAIARGIADKPWDGTTLVIINPGYTDPNWDFNLIQTTLRDSAVSYIQSAPTDKPFFLYLPLSGPHTPIAPHPIFQKKTAHNYTDFVAEIDSIVGAVVTALKAKGVFENTLIVVTSDNGAPPAWTTTKISGHQGTGILKGVNLRGGKSNIWEGGHRVPFIVHWSNVIKPGTVTDEIVNLQDLYRTVAAIAGVSLDSSEGVDSWNILPALLGNGTDLKLREAQFSVAINGREYCISYKDANGVEWKLVYMKAKNTKVADFSSIPTADFRLFNLTDDIGEGTNLLGNGVSATEKATMELLHRLMVEYRTSGRSNARDPNTAVVSIEGKRLNPKQGRFQMTKTLAIMGGSKLKIPLYGAVLPRLSVEVVDLKGRVLHRGDYRHVADPFFINLPPFATGVVRARLSIPASVSTEF